MEILTGSNLLNCLAALILKYDYHFAGKYFKTLDTCKGLLTLNITSEYIFLSSYWQTHYNAQEKISIWDTKLNYIIQYRYPEEQFLLDLGNKKVLMLCEYFNMAIKDIPTSQLTYLIGHTQHIYATLLSDQKIITTSRDQTIRVWNFEGQCQHILQCPDIPSNVACVDDKIICRFYDNNLYIWTLPSEEPEILTITNLPVYHIYGLQSINNKVICRTSTHIELFDLYSKTYLFLSTSRSSNILISENKIIFVVGNIIKIFEDEIIHKEIQIDVQNTTDNIKIRLLPNEDLLLYDETSSHLKVYDLNTEKCKLNRKVPEFSQFEILSDGRLIGINEGKIEIWF